MKNTFVKNLFEKVDLDSCCGKEAEDFTPLVSENIEMLADAVGFELTVDEVEAKKNEDAPKRSIDILAHDDDDTPVVIENQYGSADHNHLGKTLAYYLIPFGLDVKHIWVAEDFEPAMLNAINSFNKDHNFNIYAVKVEALRVVGTTNYTVKFTCLVKPEVDEEADIQEIKQKVTKQKNDIEKGQRTDLSFANPGDILEFRCSNPEYNEIAKNYVVRVLDDSHVTVNGERTKLNGARNIILDTVDKDVRRLNLHKRAGTSHCRAKELFFYNGKSVDKWEKENKKDNK